MEVYKTTITGYKITFLYSDELIIINISDKISKGNNKIKFIDIALNLEDNLRKYISNFKDLIKQIKDDKIIIKIYEEFNSFNSLLLLSNNYKIINYYFQLAKKERNEEIKIISKRIYTLNVEYYLISGANYEKFNSKPFHSYLKTNYFNLNDILNLIENEQIFNRYKIDDIKYFDEEKQVFKKINNENNIFFGKKLILHFNIKKLNNIFLRNLKWKKNYFNNEMKKLNEKFEKSLDINLKYDLIYLYGSPIIIDKNYSECTSPISYMEEIRIILKLMEKTNKKYNCKFECIGENNLRDILLKNKTKILHISAHGEYNGNIVGKYSLQIENLNQFGQLQHLNLKNLESILEPCKNNISKLDLVIVSTCYSEYLSDLFLKYGAKNVIYIDKEVQIMDPISVIFVKFFYFFLLEGNSIKESYDKSIKMMKNDKEVIHLNSTGCCCDHYHKNECIFNRSSEKKDIHDKIHSLKSKDCQCKQEESHYHYDNCTYYKNILEKYGIHMKEKKKVEDINIICCCDTNIKHNEKTKTLYKPSKVQNGCIFPFLYNKKGKTFINSKVRVNYDINKFDFIVGRKSIIGKIFNDITYNMKLAILFGEKDLAKMNFAESLCVYFI